MTLTPRDNFTPARVAIETLLLQEMNEMFPSGAMAAISAHNEIKLRPVNQKTGSFYRHFLPLRNNLVSLLTGSYRRYFKLALAHPHQVGSDSYKWASDQLQPAVNAALEWIRDWYILACDGENHFVQNMGIIKFVPGQSVSLPITTTASGLQAKSWRAPAWLFEVSIAIVGVGPQEENRGPARNSEDKLGAAHTRLLLKGARRVFLWELNAAIERVRNEETAAAGAIPEETVNAGKPRPIKRQGWKEKEKLYEVIRQILNEAPECEGKAFCAMLDKRHAPPLFDWKKSKEWREGLTWKEAWDDKCLKPKIRRVRQEAIKRS
jgi:hypothetical protein